MQQFGRFNPTDNHELRRWQVGRPRATTWWVPHARPAASRWLALQVREATGDGHSMGLSG